MIITYTSKYKRDYKKLENKHMHKELQIIENYYVSKVSK